MTFDALRPGDRSRQRWQSRGETYEQHLTAYAEIHVHDASAAQAIANGASYTKLTAFTDNGQNANCTAAAANDKITFVHTGIYHVSGAFSFSSGTANINWYGTAFLNGVEQDNVHWERKIGNAGDLGAASFSGFIDVTTAAWDLDARVRHSHVASVNITVTYANLNVVYLGPT